MPQFEFVRSQVGIVYGVVHPAKGATVELDAAFAADGVAQGFLKPVEPAKGKAGKVK